LINNLKYKALLSATIKESDLDIPFDFNAIKFAFLPELSDMEKIELQLKNQAFHETKIINKQIYFAKIKIIKFLQPYILLKLAKNLKNNKLRLIFIISGAYKFIKFNEFENLKNIYEYVYYGTCACKNMTYNEFLFDFKFDKIFTHWYQNPLNCDFESFNIDVKNKIIIWNEFDETNEETIKSYSNLLHDKENFRCFWTWHYKIDLLHDKNVIGDAEDIIDCVPELFLDFKNKYHPQYKITFSTWIQQNEIISTIIKLFRAHRPNVSFKNAENYVKLNLDESIMPLPIFAMYNYNDVKQWMNVNKDECALKQEHISIVTFLENKELYADFFLQGWWKHYNGDFNEYKLAKQNGWEHINSGFLARASDTQKIIQKAQDKLNKLLSQKDDFNQLFMQGIAIDYEENRFTMLKKCKKHKKI